MCTVSNHYKIYCLYHLIALKQTTNTVNNPLDKKLKLNRMK